MRHLRDRLLLAFGLLVAGVVLITLAAVRYTSVRALKQVLQSQVAHMGEPFELTQGTLFRQRMDKLQQIAEDPVLMELRVRNDVRSIADQAVEIARNAGVDLLLLTDLDGNVLVEIRGEDQVRGEKSLAEDPLVRRILDGGKPISCYVVYGDGHLYAVSMRALNRGEYVDGAVLLGQRVDDELTGRWARVDEATVLAAANGKVLAASDGESGEPVRPPSDFVQSVESFLGSWSAPAVLPPWKRKGAPDGLSTMEIQLADREYLGLPYPLWQVGRDTPAAWLLFLKPVDKLFALVEQQARFILALGLSAIVLALLTSVQIAKRISRPIEALAEKMRLVGEGDLHQSAEVVGHDEVARLAASFNDMVTGLRQKELLKKYVPLKARESIEHDTDGLVVLGGHRVRATVLFSDLRGFTALSERIDPDDVVTMLNDILREMIVIIHQADGDIIDYIGDAILAIFHGDDGAVRAVQASLAMQAALHEMAEHSGNPKVRGLRMGIGLHTGVLIEGNIGTMDRVKHTVVGDVVNQAARIQDRSRDGRHTCILISSETRQDVGGGFEIVHFGSEHLKGISAPVDVWEVVAARPAPAPG